ncbi:PREDICTED: uncharacterized protein LOC108379043, partial [Rhagoletis zephyria]|uniref:uncharacterized protein LOC108379043 n=1 Tax=Rhagoletis zephyria TaxID=28612 RepID=UPI00081131C7
MPPGGGNGGGGGGGPKFNMPSTFSHAPLNGGGGGIQESYHVIEEPMTITVPSGGQGQGGPHASDQADIMHSISDFIGSSENGRINSLNEGDLDQGRPMLSAPPSNDIWPLSQPELPKIVNLDVKCEKNFMKVSVEFDRPYSGMIFSKDLDQGRPMLSAPPSNDIWPLSQPELPKIVNLDVKCEKNFMKVSVEFDRPYSGMIFSKGHFSSPHCIHLAAGSGRTHIYFDIRMDSCGTTGNMGGVSPAGTFFENTVIFQYDPFLQEAWDQARKLRCTWHDQYEKSVSFRPFPVDMVDVVRADFAGDNVGCWMQIQVGRGPWASEVAGIVKIGQTMTMVLAIKDEENKFDMLVRNCVAHDGKRPPIELVDTNGCIVRSKLMSRFTKIKNFGSSASVLSYAHFQAFKFPDSMEVHFQCTIQICKHRCPEQCDASGAASGLHYSTHQISGTINTGGGGGGNLGNHQIGGGDSLYLEGGHDGAPPSRGGDSSVLARPREIRDVNAQLAEEGVSEQVNSSSPMTAQQQLSKDIGVNKVIRVVSSGDLSFATSDKLTQTDSSASSSESTNSTNSSNGSGSSHLDSARSWL